MFGVSLRGGNTEHATFFKKIGTSVTNTMVFGIGNGSTNFRTTFSAKKIVDIDPEVFLKWLQT